jgi:hypothetical protein
VTFHHDPEHSDQELDRLHDELRSTDPEFELVAGLAGAVLEV